MHLIKIALLLFFFIINAFGANRKHVEHTKSRKKEASVAISVMNNEVTDAEYVLYCYEDNKCTRITEFTIVTPLTLTCLHKLLEIKFEAYNENFTKKEEKIGFLSQHPQHSVFDYQDTSTDCQKIKRFFLLNFYINKVVILIYIKKLKIKISC